MYKEKYKGVEMSLRIDEKFFSSQHGYAATKFDGKPANTGNFKFEIVDKYYYEYQKTDMGHTYIRRETVINTNLANEMLSKHGISFGNMGEHRLLTSGRNETSPAYARGTLTPDQVGYFKSLNRDSVLDNIIE